MGKEEDGRGDTRSGSALRALWRARRGQTILITTITVGGIIAVIAVTVAVVSLSYLNSTAGVNRGYRAQAVATAGANDALLRLVRDSSLSGTTTVAIGSDAATVSVTHDSPAAGEVAIVSTATILNYTQSVCVIASVNDATGEIDVRSWNACSAELASSGGGPNGYPTPLGSWVTNSGNLPASLWYGGLFYYNNYLYYVAGGLGSGGDAVTTVYYTQATTPFSWSTTTALPTQTQSYGLGQVDDCIFVVGGDPHHGQPSVRNVYGGKINSSDGTISYWTSMTSGNGRLPSANDAQRGASYNGYIYAIGGGDVPTPAIANVYYAKPNTADCSITNWTSTTALPTTLWAHGSLAYNGYLYAIGGYRSSESTPTTTVLYAKINDDGSIGNWSKTTDMTTPIGGDYNGQDFVAASGTVYVVGGYIDAAGYPTSNAYYAAFYPDGTIGSWNTTTILPGTCNGDHQSWGIIGNAMVYDPPLNAIITAGGQDGNSNTRNLVCWAPLQS